MDTQTPQTLLIELARGQGEVVGSVRALSDRLDRRDRDHRDAELEAAASFAGLATRVDRIESRLDKATGILVGLMLGSGLTGGGVAAVVAQLLS